jgi:DNA-nicking Smr family endonuclease
MSRRKPPDPEDMALWDKVAESVAPLKARRPKEPAARPEAPAKAAPKSTATAKRAALLVAKPKPKPPAPPPLHPIDRRTMSRVNRGAVAIDTRIDLHGLTQAAAHTRLIGFMQNAQASGARMVLVITGKGLAGDGERGVLKRAVPGWLSSPELRPLVIGFEEAGRAHGGSGALLVRMRRRR